jgi:hypothetical protein
MILEILIISYFLIKIRLVLHVIKAQRVIKLKGGNQFFGILLKVDHLEAEHKPFF